MSPVSLSIASIAAFLNEAPKFHVSCANKANSAFGPLFSVTLYADKGKKQIKMAWATHVKKKKPAKNCKKEKA